MILEAAETVARVVALYVVAAVGAFGLHMLTGVLSVGPREAAHQTLDVYVAFGPFGFLAFVFTAGLYKPHDEIPADGSESVEFGTVEYPGGDEL